MSSTFGYLLCFLLFTEAVISERNADYFWKGVLLGSVLGQQSGGNNVNFAPVAFHHGGHKKRGNSRLSLLMG